MKTSPSSSKPANLSDSLHQHVHMYALAASAAGVSLLATAQPGEAEIIYTPTHQSIIENGPKVYLDLDGDGTRDFYIRATFTTTSFATWVKGALAVTPHKGDMIMGYFSASQSLHVANALPAGAVIGSKGKFPRGRKVMAYGGYQFASTYNGFCEGPWVNKKNRYLGLKFNIGGQVHFGWARLNETCTKPGHNHFGGENSAVLTGYAYETIANKAITAGQEQDSDQGVGQLDPTSLTPTEQTPATLGALAKGARGFCIWREQQDSSFVCGKK